MKKRIFSTLLMGAFFIASMSMFTSCKDYDDDINKNADAIAALQEQVTALKSSLESTYLKINDAAATYATKVELKQTDDALAALKEEVKALQEAAATKAALQQAQETLQKAIDGKADKADLDALSKTVSSINSEIDKINTALKEQAAAAETAAKNIEAQQKALDELKKALEGKASVEELNKLAKSVEGNAEAIKKLQDEVAKIDGIQKDIEQIKKDLEARPTLDEVKELMKKADDEVRKELTDKINVLTVFISKRLTSLVFKPGYYAHGIEAIELPALKNHKVLKLKGKADGIASWKEYTNADKSEIWGYLSKDGKKVDGQYDEDDYDSNYGSGVATGRGFQYKLYSDENPLFYAQYHMNPSSANIEGQELAFLGNLARWSDDTRAALKEEALATPINKTIQKGDYADGILTVPFTAPWEDIVENQQASDAEYRLPMVALQVTVGDTAVVSDYALIKATQVAHLRIAEINFATPDPYEQYDENVVGWNHLPQAFHEAWDNASPYGSEGSYWGPYFYDVCNYDESLDLETVLQVHYDYADPTTGYYVTEDEIMSKEMMKQLGIHFEYKLIDYTDVNNYTGQSKHGEIIGSVFYPRSVDADGNTITGKKATEAAIGRIPVVRVTIVTDKTNEVLSVGYLPIIITREEGSYSLGTVELKDDIYFNCENDVSSMTWSQVEAQILDQLHMSKTEFEAYYMIDSDYNNYGYSWNLDDYNYEGPNYEHIAAQYQIIDGRIYTIGQYYNMLDKDPTIGKGLSEDERDQLILKMTYEKFIPYVLYTNNDDDFFNGTNVLKWIFNYYGLPYEWLMEYAGASVESKGVSTKEISTWVRFVRKGSVHYGVSNGSWDGDIFIELKIPAGKLHFAYAEIMGKDLGHWYKNNSKDNATQNDESDAAEVHLNVPTPALHSADLVDTDFKDDLLNTFVGQKVLFKGIDNGANGKFSVFGDLDVAFEFVLPVNGVNASNLNAGENQLKGADNTQTSKYKNSWIVKGVSGAQYILQLAAGNTIGTTEGDAIVIVGRTDPEDNFRAKNVTATVVSLDGNNDSKIQFAANPYAQDILNYIGRYDYAGTDILSTYLDSSDKTFTAFVKIIPVTDACYDLLLKDSYFKVKFLRPINIMSGSKEWKDAPNETQTVKIVDLVTIRDWRKYILKDKDDDSKTQIHDSYYGVTAESYTADFGNCRTDHDKATRTAYKANQVAEIDALTKASDISALNGQSDDGVKFFEYVYVDGEATLKYRNNGQNVGDFHIYVPIYVTYSFGEWIPYTQKVYGIITVKHTVNQARQD